MQLVRCGIVALLVLSLANHAYAQRGRATSRKMAAPLVRSDGAVEGDLYLVRGDGLIAEGAANTVYLLPDTIQGKEIWEATCNRYLEWMRDSVPAQAARVQTLNPDVARPMIEGHLRQQQSVIDTTNSVGDALLRAGATFAAQTGMNAHYRFEGLAPGSYNLYATMRLGDSEHEWLVPVTVLPGAHVQIHLDNSNVNPGAALTCYGLPPSLTLK